MKTDSFAIWINQIGAVKINQDDTPMDMYQSGNTLIHFIHLTQAQHLPENFTQQLSLKYLDTPYRIIHVWEDVWMHKNDLVKSRLKAICGTSKKIHARATKACRIDKQTTQAFLNTHHLQGATGAYYKYALMHKDEVLAVATFSKARVMYDGPVYYRSYELERFACISGYTITGGLGKLLHAFIDEINPAHLMTYADADWGKGEGYAKLGFTPAGISAPQLFYVNPESHIRYYADKILALHGEVELKAKGFLRAFTAGNYKFVLDRRGVK